MTFIVKCAPRIKEWHFCCCSCSLRAAAVILAWFGAIANISEFVTFVIYLSHPNIHSKSSYETKEILVSMLSTVIGSIIFDALLLFGIHKKKPVYMLPSLVLDLIRLLIGTAIVLILSVIAFTNDWVLGLGVLIVGSILLVLGSFFWVVLYSYYHQVVEEKNPNCGIVNYTYGISNDQIQISCPEDQKALYPYPVKLAPEIA